jgi:5-methylcytosine-specific restriction endonuclease McrA
MQAGICDEEGCNLNTFGRGKCQRHYHAMWAANGGRAKISATMSRRRARMSGAKVLATDLGWPQLLAAGDGTCYLCGIPCNPLDYRELLNRGGWVQRICGPTYPTLDHIVPLSRGGSHEQNNAALACMKCNRNKSAKVARETKLSHPATDAGKDLKG